MRQSSPAIAFFLTDTAGYTTSKLWDDMLSSHILGLSPLYYCGADFRPCTEMAASSYQFLYAGALLLLSTAIVRELEKRIPQHVPVVFSMVGMLIGWAMGRAFQQLYNEIEKMVAPSGCGTRRQQDQPWACQVQHDYRYMGYALLVTFCSSVVIAILQPFATAETTNSTRLAKEFSTLLTLLNKGAATVAMILWNDSQALFVTRGIDTANEHAGAVKAKLLFFFALTLTFGGGYVAVLAAKTRRRMQADADVRVGRSTATERTTIQLLTQLEGTLGWQAGCAWTDYVVALSPSFLQIPTWFVLFVDASEATLLTCCAIGVADQSQATKLQVRSELEENREERERYFLTYALSFFVGWAWVIVARDFLYRVSRSARFLFEDTDRGFRDSRAWLAKLVEILLALIFCPLSLWLVLMAKDASQRLFDVMAGARRLWRKVAVSFEAVIVIQRAARRRREALDMQKLLQRRSSSMPSLSGLQETASAAWRGILSPFFLMDAVNTPNARKKRQPSPGVVAGGSSSSSFSLI